MFSRFLAPLVGLASLVFLGVAFWPELVGLSRTWPWAGIVALRGSAMVAALMLVLVLAFLSKLARPIRTLTKPVAFWLVVFIAASGWMLYDRGLGLENPSANSANSAATATVPSTGTRSGEITVLSWNTMGDKPAALAIARLALANNANVVVLAETSAETAHNVALIMMQGGVTVSEHAIAFDTDYIGHSTALLIADSLGEYRIDDTVGNTAVSPSIIAVPVSGEGPTIVAAHAVSPNALSMGRWRSDLTWLQAACERENVILAGDLNATVDNLSGLTMAGTSGAHLGSCVDAALTTKNAGVGTWPAWAPAWLGAPIDHVMASPSWKASAFRVLTDVDTGQADHRPIIATLTPATLTPTPAAP
ncbi:MAG: endonuclease/exonuclease/phosphatase family protein [Actinomycetales bacterium]|nr:endonuclease/exonuclease/phosphatase family protein [Actinomycetales bacterium]